MPIIREYTGIRSPPSKTYLIFQKEPEHLKGRVYKVNEIDKRYWVKERDYKKVSVGNSVKMEFTKFSKIMLKVNCEGMNIKRDNSYKALIN